MAMRIIFADGGGGRSHVRGSRQLNRRGSASSQRGAAPNHKRNEGALRGGCVHSMLVARRAQVEFYAEGRSSGRPFGWEQLGV